MPKASKPEPQPGQCEAQSLRKVRMTSDEEKEQAQHGIIKRCTALNSY